MCFLPAQTIFRYGRETRLQNMNDKSCPSTVRVPAIKVPVGEKPSSEVREQIFSLNLTKSAPCIQKIYFIFSTRTFGSGRSVNEPIINGTKNCFVVFEIKSCIILCTTDVRHTGINNNYAPLRPNGPRFPNLAFTLKVFLCKISKKRILR